MTNMEQIFLCSVGERQRVGRIRGFIVLGGYLMACLLLLFFDCTMKL